MAFENLFIRTKKSIGGIELDAVLSETHTNTVRLSSNPVELGAELTDHAIVEPKRLNIIATVSDTPLGSAAFGQIVDLVTGLFGTSTSKNLTRSNAAYNAMLQLMESREPIEVQTKLKLYENMMITGLRVAQDKNTSRIVEMNISLEEVLIAQTETVKLEPERLQEGSPREQATSADNSGRKEPTTPSETTSKSALKSIIDWVGGE